MGNSLRYTKVIIGSLILALIASLIAVTFSSSLQRSVQAAGVVPEWHDTIGGYNEEFYNAKFFNSGRAVVSLDGTRLYVTDLYNHRVQIFNTSDNSFIDDIGGSQGSGDGQFSAPSGVALTPDGELLYVVDSNNYRIQIFNTSDNSYVGQFSNGGTFSFNSPGITIAPNGLLYVAESSKITIFDTTDNNSFVDEFGSWGSGDGQFNSPKSLDVSPDGTKLYVADTDNSRIQVFDTTDNNSFVDEFGEAGSGNLQFSGPNDIIAANNGTLYIVDAGNNRVQLIDADDFGYIGELALESGMDNYGNSAANQPYGIAINPNETRLYITSYNLHNVSIFNASDNSFIDSFGEYGQNDPSGQGSESGKFKKPSDVVLSPDDTKLYVADTENDRIQVFNTSDNSFITAFDAEDAEVNELDRPRSLAITPDGTKLFVSDVNSRILVFDTANNTVLAEFGEAGDGNGEFGDDIMGLDVSPDGTKLFVGDLYRRRIQIFNTSDYSYSAKFSVEGSDMYGDPVGDMMLAHPKISPDGTKVAIVGEDSKIHILSTTNYTEIAEIDPGTAEDEYGNQTFNTPMNIAFSPNGNQLLVSVYSQESGNSFYVNIYNASNYTLLDSFGGTGSGSGEFILFGGMDFSSDGTKLYITDTDNHRVQEFRYEQDDNSEEPGDNDNDPDDNGSGGNNTKNKVNLTSPVKTAVQLQTPNETDITCSRTLSEASLIEQDSDYQYPHGLVDFCFTTSESENEVSLIFVTDLSPEQVKARKFNSNDNTFFDIANASITKTTHQGKAALLLTYTITDNGELDLNPVTGQIKDPVGLAITNELADDLANTGTSLMHLQLIAGAILVATVGMLVYRKNQGTFSA